MMEISHGCGIVFMGQFLALTDSDGLDAPHLPVFLSFASIVASNFLRALDFTKRFEAASCAHPNSRPSRACSGQSYLCSFRRRD